MLTKDDANKSMKCTKEAYMKTPHDYIANIPCTASGEKRENVNGRHSSIKAPGLTKGQAAAKFA
jgi:hypothetical protein